MALVSDLASKNVPEESPGLAKYLKLLRVKRYSRIMFALSKHKGAEKWREKLAWLKFMFMEIFDTLFDTRGGDLRGKKRETE